MTNVHLCTVKLREYIRLTNLVVSSQRLGAVRSHRDY